MEAPKDFKLMEVRSHREIIGDKREQAFSLLNNTIDSFLKAFDDSDDD